MSPFSGVNLVLASTFHWLKKNPQNLHYEKTLCVVSRAYSSIVSSEIADIIVFQSLNNFLQDLILYIENIQHLRIALKLVMSWFIGQELDE